MLKKMAILAVSFAVVGSAVYWSQANLRSTLAIPEYRAAPNWPRLPDDFKLGAVTAVATDSADNVIVFHRGKKPITVLNRDGQFLRGWGDDFIKTAHGLRVDDKGNIWVTDIGTHLVLKFDKEGKLLMTLGQKNKPGATADTFNKPTDVAVTPAGDFYVSDGYGNSRVVKFSREGKYIKEWGKKGKGEGEFNLPHAIYLDAKGRVHVGDRENDRVQVFDADGKYLTQWRDTGAPFGLFQHKGNVFVADGRANTVNQLNLDGKFLGRWGKKGAGPGEFNMPHWVCVDSRGAIYVAEVNGKRVQRFEGK